MLQFVLNYTIKSMNVIMSTNNKNCIVELFTNYSVKQYHISKRKEYCVVQIFKQKET